MIIIHASYTIDPNRQDEILQRILDDLDRTKVERGKALSYDCLVPPGDRSKIYLNSVWPDAETLKEWQVSDAHLRRGDVLKGCILDHAVQMYEAQPFSQSHE